MEREKVATHGEKEEKWPPKTEKRIEGCNSIDILDLRWVLRKSSETTSVT